ncbi:MAG: AAA family ATPase [Planctomycetaceae bacterium]|nr:AAA family ATPase [Planctomycetaceae bacterium]
MLKGFWIRNYKSLRQVGIGTCYTRFVFVNVEKDDDAKPFQPLPYDLGAVTLFTGASGTGKSTVIDVFTFVSDCYRYGVEIACRKRGGFDALYSQGGKGPLSFGFEYQQPGEEEIATYAISIQCTKKSKVPFIESEILLYQRETETSPETLPVIFLQNGMERTIRYLAPDNRMSNAEQTQIEFTDHGHLGLAALASHPKYPVLVSLRSLFENWTLCYFTPDPARGLDSSLPRRQESPRGVSLSGVVRYIIKRYKNNLKPLFLRVAAAIPNVERILLDDTDPDKPALSFQLKDRDNPVPITHLSAATIRLFTYTLLLEEEEPAPLIVLEEPENGLDREHRNKILDTLNRFETMPHTENPQVFVNTHHPAVPNGFRPSQVWVFEKDREGFTAVERASDSILFESEVELDDPQWFSAHFDEKR